MNFSDQSQVKKDVTRLIHNSFVVKKCAVSPVRTEKLEWEAMQKNHKNILPKKEYHQNKVSSSAKNVYHKISSKHSTKTF